jgi:hypothetical protein
VANALAMKGTPAETGSFTAPLNRDHVVFFVGIAS